MALRSSHRKSRHGCITCKTRRVKCDEQGPPCGNCKARGTDCQYLRPDQKLTNDTAATKDTRSCAGSPMPNPLAGRHALELHLMHRWSTDTYKSVSSSLYDDDPIWQLAMPEVAFKHDFLLNGIFAMAAFDMARSSRTEYARYISAAFEYQDLAFRGFRARFDQPLSDSYEATLYFSILLLPLDLASSQWMTPGGTLDSWVHHTAIQFELLRGVAMVLASRSGSSSDHPLFGKMKKISDLPRIPLETSTELALGKLFELNERRSSPNHSQSSRTHDNARAYMGCRKALSWLSECFATCLQEPYHVYCLQWIAYAGDDFFTAVKRRDRVALLILAYWGILIELLGLEYWWARTFGRCLIKEISGAMLDDSDETIRGILTWAQHEVDRIPGKQIG